MAFTINPALDVWVHYKTGGIDGAKAWINGLGLDEAKAAFKQNIGPLYNLQSTKNVEKVRIEFCRRFECTLKRGECFIQAIRAHNNNKI